MKNNPLNVKNDPDDPWAGSIGTDPAGHAQFSMVSFGVRAALRTMYRKMHNPDARKDTLRLLIGGHPNDDPPYSQGWASADDTIGSIAGNPPNDPDDYAMFVALHAGIGTDEKLHLFTQPGALIEDQISLTLRIFRAMSQYENGTAYRDKLSDLLLGTARYQLDFGGEKP